MIYIMDPLWSCCKPKKQKEIFVAKAVSSRSEKPQVRPRGRSVEDKVHSEVEILCTCCCIQMVEEDWPYSGQDLKQIKNKHASRVSMSPIHGNSPVRGSKNESRHISWEPLVDSRSAQVSQNVPRQTVEYAPVVDEDLERDSLDYSEDMVDSNQYEEEYSYRSEYLETNTEDLPESKQIHPRTTSGGQHQQREDSMIQTKNGVVIGKKLAVRDDVGMDKIQVQVHFTPESQRVKYPPLLVFADKSWTFLTLIRKAIADKQRSLVEGEIPVFDWIFDYDVNNGIPKLKSGVKVIFGPQYLVFRDSNLKKKVDSFVDYHMTKNSFVIKLWVFPKEYSRF